MGITVREALSIGLLKKARLLAGKKGLSRVIEHVDVIEMPDIRKWVRPNIFFLTSFYAIRDDLGAQVDLVKLLDDRGAAALAVDGHSFLRGVPREAVEVADGRGLPLIELPDEGGYIEVITPLLEAVVSRRRLKSDFLDDLLVGNFRTPEAMVHRAEFLGWRVVNKRIVLIIDIDDFEEFVLRTKKGEHDVQEIKGRLSGLVSEVTRRENCGDDIIVEKSDSLIILPAFSRSLSVTEVEQGTWELAERIRVRVGLALDEITISAGIGGVYADPGDLWRSFREASVARSIGRGVFGPGRVHRYRDLGLYQLLWELDADEKLREFTLRALKPLLDYDRARGTLLADTLEVFLDCGQDLTRTAARLYIHRSSVKYRLARIKQILGVEDFLGDRLGTLVLGLKARRYLQTREGVTGNGRGKR